MAAVRERSERWGEMETIKMLSIMKEMNLITLLDGNKRHSMIFGNISQKMAEQGFNRSAEQIKTRYVFCALCHLCV